MPAIQNQGSGPFARYWWVFMFLIIGIAVISSWPFLKQAMNSSGMDDKNLTAKEQGLKVLGSPNVPAETVSASAASAQATASTEASGTSAETGPYAHKTKDIYDPASALYQSPASGIPSPGTPADAASAQASKNAQQPGSASAGNLASALANVANSGKRPEERTKPNNSYSSQSAFSAPKANFGAMNGLGSGAGSSPASYSSEQGMNAFGTNKSNPKVTVTAQTGPSFMQSSSKSRSGGEAMDVLQNVQAQATMAAWSANSEAATGMTSRGYDLSGVKPSMNANGPHGSGVYVDGNGPVGNLKVNPSDLSKKDIQPPAPANVQPMNNGNSQIMGMMMQMLIGGLVAPMLLGGGAAGGGILDMIFSPK